MKFRKVVLVLIIDSFVAVVATLSSSKYQATLSHDHNNESNQNIGKKSVIY